MPDSRRSVCGSDVCIDIEATICLVMRVERDESREMDGELVVREAVHEALRPACFLQALFLPFSHGCPWEARISALEGRIELLLPSHPE
jgi:hypothetical protein